ncbi:MAG TPA: glycoside hydrolase family 6 protein [Solirubrobacteraceae bacterium]|nr:glycoside hydrolase family 6 protein [Solirubrobacteraceae bacterium]
MGSRGKRSAVATIGLVVVLALAAWTGDSGASPSARARGAGSKSHQAGQCSSSDTGPHNPANPLDTAGFTGTDPLSGANLFVESPWQYGGDAADAIADQVGLGYLSSKEGGNPIPWAQFEARVNRMHLSHNVSYRVHMLEKIGDYPQAHQFSLYTAGGSGSAIFTQVQNYLCRMQLTDPGAAAEITTYFVKHGGGCNGGTNPNFDAEVSALKDAVGNFPALIFVEEDAIDTICWRSSAAIAQREALLKDEIDQLSQIPHALLYVEGGTSDANSPAEAARVLNASDASKIRGFFTNDTHFNWAYKEIQYGNKVAKLTGLHFVVDTRGDGNGPLKNPHPVTQGNEQLCNPAGRGLGPKPGASNGQSYGMYSPYLDGFVWVTTPGESAAPTCPGRSTHYANSGIFDPNIAVGYASRANDRIGPSPRFKSRHW